MGRCGGKVRGGGALTRPRLRVGTLSRERERENAAHDHSQRRTSAR